MVTYVLDASAVLRYLDDEAGSGRVAEIIESHLAGTCSAILSAAHWGEIAGVTCKFHGRSTMDQVLARRRLFWCPLATRSRNARWTGYLRKVRDETSLPSLFPAARRQDRSLGRDHFDSRPDAFKLGGADKHHFNG